VLQNFHKSRDFWLPVLRIHFDTWGYGKVPAHSFVGRERATEYGVEDLHKNIIIAII
jgi:hypothetical protein